jgi:hypothetical protein
LALDGNDDARRQPMDFPQLSIGKTDDPKGRTFHVHYVASIEAPAICAPANNGTLRPVLLAYAGSPSTVRAFTMNLRQGLPAATTGRRFELLRSLGYRFQVTSPAPGQALAIAYLPDLFHLQPGVQEHDALRFVSAPPRWWLDEQEALLEPEVGSLARDHALATAFVARLDARTPLPIANDPAFHHALFLDAFQEPWIEAGGDPDVFSCDGLDALGLANPLLCDVPQQTFARFLASATAKHLPRHANPCLRREPPAPARQLALNFLTA